MKKLFVLLLGLGLSLALVGCGGPLANDAKDYYVTGQFNGWDTVADTGQMSAIAKNDALVSSIKSELKGVEFLYAKQIVLPADDAGWTVAYTIDGTEQTFNGNLTVKVIRTATGDPNTRDWWGPSPESGAISNLTPDSLFMPQYVDPSTVDSTPQGDWNSNPVALAAGTYTAVFAEFTDGSMGLGLIPVS